MLQWLQDFIGNIVSTLLYPIKTLLVYPLMSTVIKVIGSAFYTFMCMPFYLFIDFLNMFFRRICGLEGHVNFGTDPSTGLGAPIGEGEDLVMAFITSKPVMDVFISLSLIAIVLLFISTIIAIIKTEYTFDKAGNSKAPIFARAIKAVVLYLTIPAACILGIYFSNMMLKVVDQATKPGGNITISGMLFKSSCQRASRVNGSQSFALLYSGASRVNANWYFNAGQSVVGGVITGTPNDTSKPFQLLLPPESVDVKAYEAGINYAEADKLAELINTAFATGYNVNKANYKDIILSSPFQIMSQAKEVQKKYDNKLAANYLAVDGGAHLFSVTPMVKAGFSIYNLELLNFYYDLFSLDFLQVIVVGLILAKTLGGITIGVAKRLYEMVVLFVISPPVVALMPLDEGQAYKTWAKEFISRVFSLYGGVLAMNFFFMISPMVCQINFFPDVKTGDNPAALSSFLSYMPSLIFVTAGALSISSISKMLSGIIGSKDSLSEGTEMMGQVASSIGGAASFAGGVGSMIGKGFKGGFKGIKNLAQKGSGEGGDGKDADEKTAAAEYDAQTGEATNTAGAPAGGSPIAGARAGGGAGGAGGAGGGAGGQDAKIAARSAKIDATVAAKSDEIGAKAAAKSGKVADKIYSKAARKNYKHISSKADEKVGAKTARIEKKANRKKAIMSFSAGIAKKVNKAAPAIKKAITPALKGASQLGKMIGGTLLGAVGGGEFGKAFKDGSYGKMKQSEKEEKEKKAAKAKEDAANEAQQNFRDAILGNMAEEKRLSDIKMRMDAEVENERYDNEKAKKADAKKAKAQERYNEIVNKGSPTTQAELDKLEKILGIKS